MDELRLILLGIGLLIIGLIYAWGMRAQIRARFKNRRQEPGLDSTEDTDPTVDHEPDIWSQPEVRVKPAPSVESPKTDTAASKPLPPQSQQPATPRRAQPPVTPAQTTAPQPPPTTPKPTAASQPSQPSAPAQPTPTGARATPQPSQPSPSRRAQQPASAPNAPPKPAPDKTKTWNVLLTLIAPEQQPYTGQALQAAFEQRNFVLAERGVWECVTGDGSNQMIFGVAHLREPGTFDPAELSHLHTPGLLLFMPLPGPLSAATALDLMIEEAGQLRRRLGGVVCDERRHRLTPQSLLQLRTRADEFDRITS